LLSSTARLSPRRILARARDLIDLSQELLMNRTFFFRWKALASLLAAAALVCFAGCVERADASSATTFTNAWWVTGLFLLGSVVAGVVSGAYFNGKSWGYGAGWAIGCVALLALGAPSYWFEKVTVTPDGFVADTGLCGATHYDVKFADVRNIELTQEERRGRRGRRTTSNYLIIHMKSGETHKLTTTSGVCHEAEQLIVQRAAASGVEVDDE
jgi:hypothetical protein